MTAQFSAISKVVSVKSAKKERPAALRHSKARAAKSNRTPRDSKIGPSVPPISKRLELIVPPLSAPMRLDRFLAEETALGLSRSQAQKLIDKSLVFVSGVSASASHKLVGAESLTVIIPPAETTHISGEKIPLEILYEDKHLLVVNKPAGMVTHPGVGARQGTLVNALLGRGGSLSSSSGAERAGIVHRLDKDTSGLLVVAKDDFTHRALQKAITERSVTRQYLALICGHLGEQDGSIDLPLGRSLKDRTKMAVTHRKSRHAVTHYHVRERLGPFDLVELTLETGRTHQIRVHLAHIGHPVFGDAQYGGRESWARGVMGRDRILVASLLKMMPRQTLHAFRLSFAHPMSGKRVQLESPFPDDINKALGALRVSVVPKN